MAKNKLANISRFAVITGPRGSQKTLFLTSLAVRFLLQFYYLKLRDGIEKKVWSNYPIGFNFCSKLDGKIHRLESEPLDMEALYLFENSLANGWAFIDEIDQYYDRQGWMEITQRMTSAALTQIRKRGLSVGATLQDFDWLNARGQFQTDIHVSCREAAFTPWGRSIGLDLGVRAFLTSRDISGVMTGYMYKETERIYPSDFSGKQYWNCYDTNFQFNPLETKTRLKIKRPVKEFEMVDGGYRPLNNDIRSERKDRNQILITDLVHELVVNGRSEMPRSEFWRIAGDRGFINTPGTISKAGMILSSMGVEKGIKNYSFEYLMSKNQGVIFTPPPIREAPIPPNVNNKDETQPIVPSPVRRYTHSKEFKKKQLIKAGKK